MSLALIPRMQFIAVTGLPYAFAQAYFYDTGTTTPIPIYQDAGLTTTQTNPATADDEGRFPAIYLDDSALVRMKVISAGGSLVSPLIDVDPINETLLVTGADIATGAIADNLGYTPVDPANGAFTAPVTMIFAIEPTALSQYNMGYLGTPVRVADANYSFILSDAGKLVKHDDATAYTWTIPPNSAIPYPLGTEIDVTNINTGAITLHRGAGVHLRIAGSATDNDFTLAEWGYGTLHLVDTDSWIITGAGIS